MGLDRQHAAALRSLSRISITMGLGTPLACWAVIAVAVAGVLAVVQWRLPTGLWTDLEAVDAAWILAAWLPAAVLIASRQHALAVLMHEGAHYRLLPGRGLNDAYCDLLCAFPLGLVTARYRAEHLAHHADPNGPRDPNWRFQEQHEHWQFPMERGRWRRVLVADCLGLNAGEWLRIISGWSLPPALLGRGPGAPVTTACRLRAWAFVIAVVVAVALSGAWLIVLGCWLVPQFTILNAAARLRSAAEHGGLDASLGSAGTRQVLPGFWERLLLAPLHVGQHRSHHLHAAVPWYRLPALHRFLLEHDAEYAAAPVHRSYLGSDGAVAGILRPRRDATTPALAEAQP